MAEIGERRYELQRQPRGDGRTVEPNNYKDLLFPIFNHIWHPGSGLEFAPHHIDAPPLKPPAPPKNDLSHHRPALRSAPPPREPGLPATHVRPGCMSAAPGIEN